MLPNEAIIEFQEIYLNKFGMKISFEEAKAKSENFIQLFELITLKNNKNEINYEKKPSPNLHKNI